LKHWKTKNGADIFRVLGGRSNVFLITVGETNILVDTSVSRNRRKLQKRLLKSGITSIHYLILTHAHFDHASNAGQIKRKYNPLVIIQQQEAEYLSKGDNIIPSGTTLLTKPLIEFFGKPVFRRFHYEPCKPDIIVHSEYKMDIPDHNIILIHTPGHTAGSLSVLVDDEIALAGDTLFGVLPGSVFPPYAQDKELMVKSWGKLLETGCSLFIPSHGSERLRAVVKREYDKRVRKNGS
jgi:glyoxylase-like metal-dependent hydrolase (beta-lactamase superfamily II)